MHYDSLIFDLDGTLWDASRTTALGWNKALDEFFPSVSRVTARDVRSVSGKPFQACIDVLFASEIDDNRRLSDRLDAAERLAIESQGGDLYAGIFTGIPDLARYFRLFLVSNCQSWYLDAFFNHSKLQPYFEDVTCHGGSGVSKSGMIRAMVQQYSLTMPIYIGDTEGDESAASDAGVQFGFASYGFGSAHKPTHSFSSFQALVRRFIEATAA